MKKEKMNPDNPITPIILFIFIFILVFLFANKHFKKIELPITITMGYDVQMDGISVDNKSSVIASKM